MKKQVITVPGYETLTLHHLILDYNGTLAKDGELIPQAIAPLKSLCEKYHVHVITSDTFGTVQSQLQAFELTIKVLSSDNHTDEKETYIRELSAPGCIAVGNGNNDSKMLKAAQLGIALIGDEGCSTQTLVNSDIVCKTIEDALGVLLNERRLIATLRR